MDKTFVRNVNEPLDFRTIRENLEGKADKILASTSANGLMSKEDKVKLNDLQTHPQTHPASMITIADSSNKFEATNVEGALLENKTSIQNANSNISKLQSDVSANKTSIQNANSNISKLQSDVSANKTSISNLQSNVSSLQSEINGQRLRGINIANAIIDKLEG